MQVSRYVCPTDIQPWTAGPMDEHSGGGGGSSKWPALLPVHIVFILKSSDEQLSPEIYLLNIFIFSMSFTKSCILPRQ